MLNQENKKKVFKHKKKIFFYSFYKTLLLICADTLSCNNYLKLVHINNDNNDF